MTYGQNHTRGEWHLAWNGQQLDLYCRSSEENRVLTIATNLRENDAPLLAVAKDLRTAAVQALDDLKWVEKQDPRNNFQASILALEAALKQADTPFKVGNR